MPNNGNFKTVESLVGERGERDGTWDLGNGQLYPIYLVFLYSTNESNRNTFRWVGLWL